MRTSQELHQLREQAVMLRRQGKSRRQIKEILGPMSDATLNDALKNEPLPEWTRRPRARDDRRARARELRGQGMDYEEIATALGVSKSSVSLSSSSPARSPTGAKARKASRAGAASAWSSSTATRI
jgi:DNA-binding CsgD family transcriptional regulator